MLIPDLPFFEPKMGFVSELFIQAFAEPHFALKQEKEKGWI